MSESIVLSPATRRAVRALLRFAVAMLIFGLLTGILFQESSKRLPRGGAPAGEHLDAILPLALVHGHALLLGTVLPLSLAGALVAARACGARDVSARALAWLVRGALPCTAASVGLMLYKGYHTLLSVRWGATDLEAVDARFFGGLTALRHAVYGLAHVGLAVSLVVFAIGLWRSLGPGEARRG